MSNTQKRVPKTLSEARAEAMANPLVAAIVNAQDIPHEDVEVPEWGNVKLRIRGLDGKGRDAYEAQMFVIRATTDEEVRIDLLANRNANILAKCLCDPATDQLLPISVDMLGAKSGEVTARLAKIALGLSGLGPKAKEESGKDLENDQSEGSTTD